MTPSGPGAQRTITAFFDNRGDADEAVRRLQSEGFPRDSVRLMAGHERDNEGDVNPDNFRATYDANEGMSFWDALKDLFLPQEDRHAYAEGLRRGGYLVSVQTRDANHARALDILDDEGTIDIDERAQEWRREGWTGYSPGTTGSMAAGAVGAAASTTTGLGTGGATPGRSGLGAVPPATAAAAGRGAVEREPTVPVTDEDLRIGRREAAGRRARSYVLDEPAADEARRTRVEIEDERARGGATGTAGRKP
jgi:hypothetical protein